MQKHTNTHLQLAKDYVYYTSKSVFLTGKAGTGKTTFLRTLRQDCPKQHAVLAPTGVAAINAGGTTIHSFFNCRLGRLYQRATKPTATNPTTNTACWHGCGMAVTNGS
ncbi:AAA family ATPase [Phnomibacter ginsenosidimutans]|uniref:AAA family ATPase n=1 Tax=Phnomibacter ginsenosidimutans TaxID=2676868 RepID=A0A6I6GM18_9BACT|nr:AAA family ATPase [Phnomibacter ginsenosidimutans]QGW29535.1 AAA family ATPase [Phnomibacter ginsenosidimutans]